MMKRSIGMQLRCNQSLSELVEKATRLDLSFFQCFLRQPAGNIINTDAQETIQFRDYCSKYNQLFVHASYLINLANSAINHHPALRQELYWAQKLGFTHMILHPGSSSLYESGINAIARVLNSIIKSTSDITFVLENVAFTTPSIGGSLNDLRLIRDKIDKPERLGFCIDTAHAYAYGYDIATRGGQDQFLQLLGQTVSIESIKLIHVNDTESVLGSHQDTHCRLGLGNIGVQALKEFVLDSRLQHIPLLLELPVIEEAEEEQDLMTVRSWKV